jgi:hypothetical protein
MARRKHNTHQLNADDLQSACGPNKTIKHGVRSKLDLEIVDGRTKLGKAIAALRTQLRDYARDISPASELLIQRVIYKSVKLAIYESRMIQNPDEAAHYLPMANSLRLDLAALADIASKSKPTKGRDIAEIIDTFRGNI